MGKKKFVLWFLVAVLLVVMSSLIACGGGTATTPTKPTTPATTPPKTTPTAAAAPAIPHSLEGRAECLVCHETGVGGAAKVPADHAGRTNATCSACHKPK